MCDWDFERYHLKFGDLRTTEGLQKAITVAKARSQICSLHLHGSLPCTPWAGWQRYNQSKMGKLKLEKLAADRADSELLLANFSLLARFVRSVGGTVSFEWPTGCLAWKLSWVVAFIAEFKLSPVNIHGCSCGVVSSKTGQPIKKPWTFMSDSQSLLSALAPFRCACKVKHAPRSGSETVKTGFYPPQLARTILLSIEPSVISCVACEPEPVLGPEYVEFEDDADLDNESCSSEYSFRGVCDSDAETDFEQFDEPTVACSSIAMSPKEARKLAGKDKTIQHMTETINKLLGRQTNTKCSTSKLAPPSDVPTSARNRVC